MQNVDFVYSFKVIGVEDRFTCGQSKRYVPFMSFGADLSSGPQTFVLPHLAQCRKLHWSSSFSKSTHPLHRFALFKDISMIKCRARNDGLR